MELWLISRFCCICNWEDNTLLFGILLKVEDVRGSTRLGLLILSDTLFRTPPSTWSTRIVS